MRTHIQPSSMDEDGQYSLQINGTFVTRICKCYNQCYFLAGSGNTCTINIKCGKQPHPPTSLPISDTKNISKYGSIQNGK